MEEVVNYSYTEISYWSIPFAFMFLGILFIFISFYLFVILFLLGFGILIHFTLMTV